MTAFTFSAEQLRAAPPEVRRWVANEIARTLGAFGTGPAEPPRGAQLSLAACTAPEAMQVFELIGGDAILGRLFFELARENSFATNIPGVRALRVADLLHHAGLPDPASLSAGLAGIDQAFRQARADGAASEGDGGSLFGFDDSGHVFVHATTQASIRRVWEELVQARAAAHEAVMPSIPQTEGFMPPQMGPSEPIAPHAAAAGRLPL